MTSSLLYKIINLFRYVSLLTVLELHPPQLIIDSLNHNLSSLIKFLSASLLSSLPSLLNQLHQLLLLKLSRELALRIHLIVFFFPVMFLISFKDMLDDLVASAACALVSSDGRRHKLLLALFSRASAKGLGVFFVSGCGCGCRLVLLEDLGVQEFEGDQGIVDEGYQDGQKRLFACTHNTHSVLTGCAEVALDA